MKSIKLMLAGASLLLCCGCGMQVKESTTVTEKASNENAVIENMMSRRSIRKYKPQAVNRDTMQIILNCGINAPNGQNKQSWAIRVVDNPDFINGITEVYKKQNPKAAEDPNFKNMFRNAPTIVFIANDKSYDLSQIDCALVSIQIGVFVSTFPSLSMAMADQLWPSIPIPAISSGWIPAFSITFFTA